MVGLAFVVPSFFAKETVAGWPWFVPRAQINLGLDLRGGAHLLLSMETTEVRKDWLETLRDDARKRLRDAKIAVTGVGIVNNGLQVRLAKAEDADAAFKELKGLAQPTGDLIRGLGGTDLDVRKAEGGVIAITPTEAGLQHRITDAISAAIETVRRRVDFTGTTEAQIVRQGSDRILVQVPGLQDTAPLKELIGKTARLTFHEVNPTISAEEAKKTRPPTGYRVYPGSDREEGDQLLRETPGGARRRAEERAAGLRPADARADHRLHLQRLGRAQVRRVHQDARRPPVRHRARRQGDLCPCHSRRDPRRLRPDQRQLHGRDRQPARHPAALGRAAGQAHGRSRSAWSAPASARTRSRPASSPR